MVATTSKTMVKSTPSSGSSSGLPTKGRRRSCFFNSPPSKSPSSTSPIPSDVTPPSKAIASTAPSSGSSSGLPMKAGRRSCLYPSAPWTSASSAPIPCVPITGPSKAIGVSSRRSNRVLQPIDEDCPINQAPVTKKTAILPKYLQKAVRDDFAVVEGLSQCRASSDFSGHHGARSGTVTKSRSYDLDDMELDDEEALEEPRRYVEQKEEQNSGVQEKFDSELLEKGRDSYDGEIEAVGQKYYLGDDFKRFFRDQSDLLKEGRSPHPDAEAKLMFFEKEILKRFQCPKLTNRSTRLFTGLLRNCRSLMADFEVRRSDIRKPRIRRVEVRSLRGDVTGTRQKKRPPHPTSQL